MSAPDTLPCPECGHALYRHEGTIEEPVITPFNGEARRARPCVFYACEHCEYITEGSADYHVAFTQPTEPPADDVRENFKRIRRTRACYRCGASPEHCECPDQYEPELLADADPIEALAIEVETAEQNAAPLGRRSEDQKGLF